MQKYDFKKVETKWQKKWEELNLYAAKDFDKRPKYYCLVEFPYPSGEGLHIGHGFSYVGGDVYARKKRMDGFNVLFPMGWDAFGLPTENFAIRTGVHPTVATKKNTDNYRKTMKRLAYSFDWGREVNTTDPKYYKWTQWIFIKLFEAGLAYKEEKPINWCPSCKIGLANEEVVDGKCERCGADVTKKNLSQWVVRITKYADRLLEGLKQTEFVEKVKAAQINWIDRSEGANVKFKVDGLGKEITVFTTRPDTLWGATFMVVAPEHWLVSEVMNKKEVAEYVEQSMKKSELERSELQKDKTGVFTGLYAINPVTEKKIPIWIGDFVLSTYGTGAIMSVPAHDTRDFAFAKKFDLPVVPVIEPKGGWDFDSDAYTDVKHGKMINSGFVTGLSPDEAIKKAIAWLEEKGLGEKTVNYHLRDWIFSRQHYWGEPIPMVHCEKCGWVPVPEDQLPIELPPVEKYQPTETGESPLAAITDWVNTKCPKCGGDAKRETDVMPNWAGSDWYFLRYTDPGDDKVLADMDKMAYWMPVDTYFGGDEHNTLHLLYSRFIYIFLWDIGAVPKNIPEPYFRRISHGVILGPDGQRMSKSRGNIIVPDKVADKYGVDTFRTYVMFMGPFDATMAWNENALRGVERFLNKLYQYVSSYKRGESDVAVKSEVNRLLSKVGKDIENYKFNTAIASMMETLNKISSSQVGTNEAKMLTQVIAPFAPYLAEELWDKLGEKGSIHASLWPKVDASAIEEESTEIPVQINGKVRARIAVTKEMSENDVKKAVMALDAVQKHLEGKDPKKFIYVPLKIATIVV